MKNLKSKFIMPIAVMAFAIAGAFATDSFANENAFAEVDGYVLDMNGDCEKTSIRCTTTPTAESCTTEDNKQLYEISASGTSCPNELFRIPE